MVCIVLNNLYILFSFEFYLNHCNHYSICIWSNIVIIKSILNLRERKVIVFFQTQKCLPTQTSYSNSASVRKWLLHSRYPSVFSIKWLFISRFMKPCDRSSVHILYSVERFIKGLNLHSFRLQWYYEAQHAANGALFRNTYGEKEREQGCICVIVLCYSCKNNVQQARRKSHALLSYY